MEIGIVSAFLGVLLVSYIIVFFGTKRSDGVNFLYWDNCPGRRSWWAIISNTGASISNVTFIYCQMIMALCWGTWVAAVIICSIASSYFWYAKLVGDYASHDEYSDDNRFPEQYRLSLMEIIRCRFGLGILFTFVVLLIVFILFNLGSEVAFLYLFLKTLLHEFPHVSGCLILGFILSAAVYVWRGGYEGVFKTDCFQVVVCFGGALIIVFWTLSIFGGHGVQLCFHDIVRGLWAIWSHPDNTNPGNLKFLPGASPHSALIILLIVCVFCLSFVFASVDGWNRSVIFLKDRKKTKSVLRCTALLVTLYSVLPITFGLFLRTRPELRFENGFTNGLIRIDPGNPVSALTFSSFETATAKLPFSPEIKDLIETASMCHPWLTLFGIGMICAMALTTFDSFVLLIGQVTDQTISAMKRRELGRRRSLRWDTKDASKIVLLSCMGVALIARFVWQEQNSFYCLYGWSILYVLAVIVFLVLLGKGSEERCQRAKRILSVSYLILGLLGLFYLPFAQIFCPRLKMWLPLFGFVLGIVFLVIYRAVSVMDDSPEKYNIRKEDGSDG